MCLLRISCKCVWWIVIECFFFFCHLLILFYSRQCFQQALSWTWIRLHLTSPVWHQLHHLPSNLHYICWRFMPLCSPALTSDIDDFNLFISVLFAQCCISENFGELLLCFVHSSLCYDFSHNSWFEVFVLEHIWNIFFLIHYIKFCFQTYIPYIKSYAMANNSIPTPTNP